MQTKPVPDNRRIVGTDFRSANWISNRRTINPEPGIKPGSGFIHQQKGKRPRITASYICSVAFG
jgi:hypothetical protein